MAKCGPSGYLKLYLSQVSAVQLANYLLATSRRRINAMLVMGNFPFRIKSSNCIKSCRKSCCSSWRRTSGRQRIYSSRAQLSTSLLPNSEVCALIFLCFLTSLYLFLTDVARGVATFSNGVVSDDGPRCFGVARDETRAVGDRVGVSSTDSLAPFDLFYFKKTI